MAFCAFYKWIARGDFSSPLETGKSTGGESEEDYIGGS